MKRHKNLVRATMLLLLTMLTSNIAWADNTKVTVWLNDGTKTDVQFAKNPVITYADGTLTLASTSGDKSWPLSQLRKLTFGEGQTMQVETEEGDAVEVDIEVETSYANKEAVITAAIVSESGTGNGTLAIPSEVDDSSTVITPSFETLSIASATSSPTSSSPAEIAATLAI